MKKKVYNIVNGESFETDDISDDMNKINIKRTVCYFETEDATYSYKFRLSLNLLNNKPLLSITTSLKNKVFKTRTFYLNYYTYFFPISLTRGIFIQIITQGLGYVYAGDI